MQKIKVSIKDAEKDEISAAAERLSITLSAFMRMAALEKARSVK
jgi:uncharacterized protein (DUF1778 family)